MSGAASMAVVAGLLMAWSAIAAAQSGNTCVPDFALDACAGVQGCQDELREDPYDVAVRITLCEALVAEGELLDAMVVLRDGLSSCGGRSYACSQIQLALSNVEELAEKSAPDLQAERRREQEFKRQYCLGPSASDQSIEACNEALLAYGDDGALYQALGVKYQRRGQPAQAVRNLERAATLMPRSDELRSLLAEAEQTRRELSRACLSRGDLEACNAAVLSGAADELDLQRRRGELLLAAGRRDSARQAFLNAQALDPDDRRLARDVLPLVEEGLEKAPDDPELNGARAASLAVLGNVDEAILAYRRTLELHPGDETAAERLMALRERRRDRLEQECFTGGDIERCRDSLIPGEPDEQRIRAQVAALQEAREPRGEPDASDAPAREAVAEPAIALESPLRESSREYRNVANADGSTH